MKIKISEHTRITIVGDGGWGTTLAVYFARFMPQVILWGAFPEYINAMNTSRENTKFLPGAPLSSAIMLTSDINEAIAGGDIILLAVPSQYLREVLAQIKQSSWQNKIFISATKGLEENTFFRPTEIIAQELPGISAAALSGPTIAKEIAFGMPAAALIAHQAPDIADSLRDLFQHRTFRVYSARDVVGVEVGGAMKNIIALACGISDGLGFETNTKAALMTRGLVEIARLGVSLGADERTFQGLSGIGDLMTTCMNHTSRNRSFGEALGRGEDKDIVLKNMEMVVEGVETVKAAYQLMNTRNIVMPITEQVYAVLYQNRSPRQAVEELLARDLTSE